MAAKQEFETRQVGRTNLRMTTLGVGSATAASIFQEVPDQQARDTIGDEVAIAREGLVTALVGQRPFEMGYKAPSVMIDLIEGKTVADPVFTGLDECTKDTADTCIQK